jgi:hypothetical protein
LGLGLLLVQTAFALWERAGLGASARAGVFVAAAGCLFYITGPAGSLLFLVGGCLRRMFDTAPIAPKALWWMCLVPWTVGVFTRPYFAHMSADGRFSKPFLLPQEDPRFYDSFDRTYNLPEFLSSPVTVTSRKLVRGVFRPEHRLKPVMLDPNAAPSVHEADEGRSAELESDGPSAR